MGRGKGYKVDQYVVDLMYLNNYITNYHPWGLGGQVDHYMTNAYALLQTLHLYTLLPTQAYPSLP